VVLSFSSLLGRGFILGGSGVLGQATMSLQATEAVMGLLIGTAVVASWITRLSEKRVS
jgi:hypothetical protein